MRGLSATALLLLAVVACREADTPPADSTPRLSAVETLAGGAVDGYLKAIEPHAFSFPEDHGPHPDFKTEWWYFTGHLSGPGDERFGYQLTFFRQALAPAMPERSSAWATRQLYLAHFALSVPEDDKFHAFERLSRNAVGLAGAGGDRPFKVWLEDWSVESIGSDAFPVRLLAKTSDLALELTLENEKPAVFHGDQGLSRKGADPGSASYYYSMTRLAATGRLHIKGRQIPVTGSSWLDREWSTSVLARDQVGWDWFSLQLDDRRELMVFQLRLENGGIDPASHGTLVAVDSSTRTLDLGDFQVEVLGTWRSPRGATYPASWRLKVPSESLDLTLEPLVADQELDVSFRYWEGAVDADGTAAGKPVSGRGYVELVGYAN